MAGPNPVEPILGSFPGSKLPERMSAVEVTTRQQSLRDTSADADVVSLNYPEAVLLPFTEHIIYHRSWRLPTLPLAPR